MVFGLFPCFSSELESQGRLSSTKQHILQRLLLRSLWLSKLVLSEKSSVYRVMVRSKDDVIGRETTCSLIENPDLRTRDELIVSA